MDPTGGAPPDLLVGWGGKHSSPFPLPLSAFGICLSAFTVSIAAFRHFFFLQFKHWV